MLLVKPEYWIGSNAVCEVCRSDDPFCEPRHARQSLPRYRRGSGSPITINREILIVAANVAGQGGGHDPVSDRRAAVSTESAMNRRGRRGCELLYRSDIAEWSARRCSGPKVPPIRLGRDASCEINVDPVANPTVSGLHARIGGSDASVLIHVSRSNKTLLNDAVVETTSPVKAGDRIKLGYTGPTIELLSIEAAALAPAAASDGSGRTVQADARHLALLRGTQGTKRIDIGKGGVIGRDSQSPVSTRSPACLALSRGLGRRWRSRRDCRSGQLQWNVRQRTKIDEAGARCSPGTGSTSDRSRCNSTERDWSAVRGPTTLSSRRLA